MNSKPARADGNLSLAGRISITSISGDVIIYPQDAKTRRIVHSRPVEAAVPAMLDADDGAQLKSIVQPVVTFRRARHDR